jgi:hypothetical protein
VGGSSLLHFEERSILGVPPTCGVVVRSLALRCIISNRWLRVAFRAAGCIEERRLVAKTHIVPTSLLPLVMLCLLLALHPRHPG